MIWCFRAVFAVAIGMIASVAIADEDVHENGKEYSAEELMGANLARIDGSALSHLEDYEWNDKTRAIILNCRMLGVTAWTSRVGCTTEDTTKDGEYFSKRVEYSLGREHAKFASIRGASISTDIYFRVLLVRNEKGFSIQYFPNWGHDGEKYGYDYEAPQRLPLASSTYSFCPRNYRVISLTTIGEDGVANGDIELQGVRANPSRECTQYIEQKLRASQYIPARLNGERIEARHLELWGNWGN